MNAARDRFQELPTLGRWGVGVGATLFAWLVLGLTLPNGAPAGQVAAGAVIGSATALTAIGLILLWRANRIINFAYGAMGGAVGIASTQLHTLWGWNYGVTLVIGVVAGVVLGMLLELLIIRRFRAAPRLVLTVATIGLTQVLAGVEALAPQAIFGEATLMSGGFDTPLDDTSVELGSTLLNGNHFLIVAVVPVVVVALGWFLKRTAAGTAIRAAADNTERARLLGIPVRRLHTLVWAIAGGLAALTFVLKAPHMGSISSAATGPTILLPALAAAVIARMESLPVAFASAIALGSLDQVVRWNTTTPSLTAVVTLGVILAALLLQRSGASRAHDAEGAWRDASPARPVPPALRRLPEFRIPQFAFFLGLAALIIWIPSAVGVTTLNTLSVMMIWGMVAVSLVVLTGWAGQISLGQFALVGVGALVTGNLITRWDIDLVVSLIVGGLATGLVALTLGVPALRIKGPFLGVVTMAFAVALDAHVLNPTVFPNLLPESLDRPTILQRFPLEEERTMFWVCFATLVLVVLAARGVRRTRSGRLLLASRDNSKAAEAMSVSTRWVTLSAFVFSGTIAGIAGGLHVILLHGARQGSYLPADSIRVFTSAAVGGLGSVEGALLTTMGMRGLDDVLTSAQQLILSGTGVLVILLLVPGGLAKLATSLRDRYLRQVARRRKIAVQGFEIESSKDTAADGSEPSALQAAALQPAPGLAATVGHHDVTAVTQRPILTCTNVDVSYGQLQVLFDVGMDVGDGEMVALLGTNGAGKSTMLRAMCGLVPTKGKVMFGDEVLSGRQPEHIVRAGVALMAGGRGTFPTLNVADNLRLATWTFRKDRGRIHEDLARMEELFPVLGRRKSQLAGDLSGGEQQQLALAMTIMLRPKLLLIDELSLGLAPTVVSSLLDVVRNLNDEGTTVVVVEQSVNVALTLAERALFMEKGQVRFEGPTRELLDRPDLLRAVFLEGAGTATGATAKAGAGANGNGADDNGAGALAVVDLTKLSATPVANGNGTTGGKHKAPALPPIPDYDHVLECHGVSKRFGGITAVDQVDLVVTPGEIVGLIGQNGAGKTTLVDCISGFHSLDGGNVVFRGHDITDWHPFERARGRLGRSFQEARLFPSLTVRETIAVALERTVASRSLVADALRQPASYESELLTAERVEELVELLGLGDYAGTPSSELSTGTRRVVELACLLAADPVLLLLDEPSAGVAQRETEQLGPLLLSIRDRTGAAMVIVEHDMPLLSAVSDRLVALDLGAVITEGRPQDVLSDDRVIASYLGTDDTAILRSGTPVP